MDMLFSREQIRLIFEGKKTTTRRLYGLYRLGVQALQPSPISRAIGKIDIIRKYQQRLGDMTEEDARKEGGYTLEEFRQIWQQIYGKWDPEQLPWVYDFVLVEAPMMSAVNCNGGHLLKQLEDGDVHG